jgi:uncharacterized membrane protein
VVATRRGAADVTLEVILRPNQSLTWRANLIVIGFLFIASLVVAIGFTLQGFWPILPFAGLELVVLTVAFYCVGLARRECQVVRIGDGIVEIEKGRRLPGTHIEIPRHWARVSLRRASVAWYPSRLAIRSHGREVVIGEFLTEEERRTLAGDLAAHLGWAGT